jgi:hypothetical protein
MAADNPRLIEDRIAELRERMRATLDRTKLPRLQQELLAEIAKLKTLGGGEAASSADA